MMKVNSMLLSLALMLPAVTAQVGRTIEVGGSVGIGWMEGVCYHPIDEVTVGDKLVFNYAGHDVYQMPDKEAFEACDFSSAVMKASPAQNTLEYEITEQDVSEGTLYFACSVGDHCAGGMQKLVVNVVPNLGSELQLQSEEADMDEQGSNVAVSQVSFGVSKDSCVAIHNNEFGGTTEQSRQDSPCTEPEIGDDGRYHVSCLSPPATMTPGGVINNLFVLNYPYPRDRRVLVGMRTWEFVMDDPEDPSTVIPVPINQLYVHHLSGRVVLGQGTEGIRRSEPDAPYPPPYGVVTGDEGDTMVFHIIDLRDVDDWLPCIECRCQAEDGTYLNTGGGDGSDFGVEFSRQFDATMMANMTGMPDMSPAEAQAGITGGVSCCTNCTDLKGPTIDYRMRYNVSFSNITNENPVSELIMLTADVSPVVGKNIEFDVPAYQNLDPAFQKEGQPWVQRLERTMPFRELFQHEFFGESYYGPDTVRLFRCVAHLHVAAMGMWLEDAETKQMLCRGTVQYGTDPEQDKGFLNAVHVDDYGEDPVEFPADRLVTLITEYNATEVHTGVMGMYFIFIDGNNTVDEESAALSVDLCVLESCDTSMLPQPTMEDVQVEDCEDTLADHPACRFGSLCDCSALIADVGCGGVYDMQQGSLEINSVCAKSCECPSSSPSAANCADTLAENPACTFGGMCDCEEFVNHPDSTGCGGVFASNMGDIQINDVCTAYCDACVDTSAEDRLVEMFVEQLENDLDSKCKFATAECRLALKNALSCSHEMPGIEAFDEDQQILRTATVAHAGRLAEKYSQLGAVSLWDEQMPAVTGRSGSDGEYPPCDDIEAEEMDMEEEGEAMEEDSEEAEEEAVVSAASPYSFLSVVAFATAAVFFGL